jgi:hypothetical protein
VKPTTLLKNNPAISLSFLGPERILIAGFYCIAIGIAILLQYQLLQYYLQCNSEYYNIVAVQY